MKFLSQFDKFLGVVTPLIAWPVYLAVGAISLSVSLFMLYASIALREPRALPFSIGLLFLAATWLHVKLPTRTPGFYGKYWLAIAITGISLFFLGGTLLIRSAA